MEIRKALLVQQRRYREPDLLYEFEALATTAGYVVVGQYDIVTKPSAKFGIGSGKVEEIREWIQVGKPDVVLYSPKLKSSQIFRLMEAWDLEVRDRTQVILEIFDRHARTPQAKLQIEQARLKYELPFERHQIRMRLQKEHTGDRPIAEQVGAGEDLVSKRISELRKRIAHITARLEKISKAQSLKRKKRSREGFLEVTLAGYTNSGKSTLHRALTGSEVKVADELFTTLSTKASLLPLAGRQAVLSDSVGFISNLPNQLLQAFNTTLMEITDADVILLVIDGFDDVEEMFRKLVTCQDTFLRVGADGIPIVVALNKIDLLDNDELEAKMNALNEFYPEVIPISAEKKTNLDHLLRTIDSHLPHMHRYSVVIPTDDSGMSLLSWLHDAGNVLDHTFRGTEIHVDVEMGPDVAAKILMKIPSCKITRVMEDSL